VSTGTDTHLALGVLGRPHGVRGELVFRPHNMDGTPLWDLDLPLDVRLHPRQGPPQPGRVVAARPFGEAALVRLAGVDDRDQAARFTNCELHVPRDRLPPLEADEFYVADLIGCRVLDAQGRDRGLVRNAFWNGVQDVLEIRDEAGHELLIPAAGDFLLEVDMAGRRVVIDDHQPEEDEEQADEQEEGDGQEEGSDA
jgi:16S rRNA processing protein RimM